MKRIISSAIIATLVLSSSQVAFAHHKKHHCKKHHHCKAHHEVMTENNYKGEPMPMAAPVNTFVPNWYVGGAIGESRTHDKATPGSIASVTQIGPGWNVDLGYQFFQAFRTTFAAELGYTQYHKSNETTPGINVASTEHYAVYLAAVAQVPLAYNFSILGKLGVANSYAKKTFAFGASNSANVYSAYYGVGLAYNITPSTSLQLQWDRARGNSKTGSTDLTSLGISHSFL